MDTLKSDKYLIELSAYLAIKKQTLIEYLRSGNIFPIVSEHGSFLVPNTSGDEDLAFDMFTTDLESNLPCVQRIIIGRKLELVNGSYKFYGNTVYVDMRVFNFKALGDSAYNCKTAYYKYLGFECDLEIESVDDDTSFLLTAWLEENDDDKLEFDYNGKVCGVDYTRGAFLPYDENHNFTYDHHPLDIYNGVHPGFSSLKKKEAAYLESFQTPVQMSQMCIKPESITAVPLTLEEGKMMKSAWPSSIYDNPQLETVVMTNQKASLAETVKTSVSTNIIDPNKLAIIAAGKLEIGSLALDLITEQFIKVLPVPVQMMFGQNPAMKILVANIANIAISQMSLDDPRIAIVNEAMMTVAWQETFKSFNFADMISNALDKLPAAKLANLVKATTEQSVEA